MYIQSQITCLFSIFDSDFDDDQDEDTADGETEGGDTFAADNFDIKVTSARAGEPRRSSLSTEMLVCVEAEGALDQAIMAADLALANAKKGSSSADFRAEISGLKSAIARMETIFGKGKVIGTFFSDSHVKEVQLMVARARRRLNDLETGDTRRQSVLVHNDDMSFADH